MHNLKTHKKRNKKLYTLLQKANDSYFKLQECLNHNMEQIQEKVCSLEELKIKIGEIKENRKKLVVDLNDKDNLLQELSFSSFKMDIKINKKSYHYPLRHIYH